MASALFAGCEKNPQAVSEKGKTPVAAPARGPNPRFYTVQEKLDQGGSFYFYADVKDLLRPFLKQLEANLTSTPNTPPQVHEAFLIADHVLDRLGVYGIQDIGLSTLPEPNLMAGTPLNRNKMFIGSDSPRAGLLALLGGEPHGFDMLKFAPAETMSFATADFDTSAALNLVRRIAQDIGGPRMLQQLNGAFLAFSAAAGANLETLLASFSGEVTFVATLDKTAPLSFPSARGSLSIDRPRAALILRVNNSLLYDTIKAQTGTHGLASQEDLAPAGMRRLNFRMPASSPFSPVLAQDEHFFYMATDADWLDKVLQAKAAGGGLDKSDAFKLMATGLPTQGNALYFMSSQLGPALKRNLESVMRSLPGEAQQAAFLEMVAEGLGRSGPSYGVRVNEPKGVMGVSRSPFGSNQYLAPAALAPVAVLTAIAVPGFVKAQNQSRVSHVKADLRSMAVAIESYYVDSNAYPAWSANPAENANASYASANPNLGSQPTFMTKGPGRENMMTLTTPVQYITSYLPDPFSAPKGVTYSYWGTGNSWILWSPGPDEKYDLTMDNIGQMFDPKQTTPSAALLEKTFDPTNGTTSGGDIWRIKQ